MSNSIIDQRIEERLNNQQVITRNRVKMAKTVTDELHELTGTKDMDSSVDFGPIETEQEDHKPFTKIFVKENAGSNSIDSFDQSPIYSVFP